MPTTQGHRGSKKLNGRVFNGKSLKGTKFQQILETWGKTLNNVAEGGEGSKPNPPPAAENIFFPGFAKGNGEILKMPNLIGCLSGAGRTTKSGHFGPRKLFCGVNTAFSCPDMVPNPLYNPSLVASFTFSTNWFEPKGYGTSLLGLQEKFYPTPSVAYQLQ